MSFASRQSLLDADIVLYAPSIGHAWSTETFQGKPSLGESASFTNREQVAHWRAEINAAVKAGKLVFAFLEDPVEVFVRTGDQTFSGTGRNQKVTSVVAPMSSYDAIPTGLKFRPVHGTKVRVTPNSAISTYWSEFGERSGYRVLLEGELSEVLLVTKSGGQPVAGVLRSGGGCLVLLPPPAYDEEAFWEWDEEEEVEVWSEEACQFGKRLIASLIDLAAAIQGRSEKTPPPEWTMSDEYRLAEEALLEDKIATKTARMATLADERERLEARLEDVVELRALLYEKGHPLERSVREVLRLFRFEVEPLDDGESEFDAVFISKEGRLLGEVEGKDRKAIDIAKASQLERNIQEDFARESVDVFAKGALFGNAYRLESIDDRSKDFFTKKCRSAAARVGMALVRTPDLFAPARYLRENRDATYAAACRKAFIDAVGTTVEFPAPPDRPGAVVEALELEDG